MNKLTRVQLASLSLPVLVLHNKSLLNLHLVVHLEASPQRVDLRRSSHLAVPSHPLANLNRLKEVKSLPAVDHHSHLKEAPNHLAEDHLNHLNHLLQHRVSSLKSPLLLYRLHKSLLLHLRVHRSLPPHLRVHRSHQHLLRLLKSHLLHPRLRRNHLLPLRVSSHRSHLLLNLLQVDPLPSLLLHHNNSHPSLPLHHSSSHPSHPLHHSNNHQNLPLHLNNSHLSRLSSLPSHLPVSPQAPSHQSLPLHRRLVNHPRRSHPLLRHPNRPLHRSLPLPLIPSLNLPPVQHRSLTHRHLRRKILISLARNSLVIHRFSSSVSNTIRVKTKRLRMHKRSSNSLQPVDLLPNLPQEDPLNLPLADPLNLLLVDPPNLPLVDRLLSHPHHHPSSLLSHPNSHLNSLPRSLRSRSHLNSLLRSQRSKSPLNNLHNSHPRSQRNRSHPSSHLRSLKSKSHHSNLLNNHPRSRRSKSLLSLLLQRSLKKRSLKKRSLTRRSQRRRNPNRNQKIKSPSLLYQRVRSVIHSNQTKQST